MKFLENEVTTKLTIIKNGILEEYECEGVQYCYPEVHNEKIQLKLTPKQAGVEILIEFEMPSLLPINSIENENN